MQVALDVTREEILQNSLQPSVFSVTDSSQCKPVEQTLTVKMNSLSLGHFFNLIIHSEKTFNILICTLKLNILNG